MQYRGEHATRPRNVFPERGSVFSLPSIRRTDVRKISFKLSSAYCILQQLKTLKFLKEGTMERMSRYGISNDKFSLTKDK